MPLNDKLKKKIISLLAKFKIEEFQLLFPSVFPKISQQHFNRLFHSLLLPINSRNIAEVLILIFEETSPTIDECNEKLFEVYLHDAAFHNNHNWRVVELQSEVTELPDKISDLNKAVTRGYRSRALNASVHSILFNDIIWSVVIEKVLLKKGGMKCGPPQFFAFNPDLDVFHLFFSPVSMDRNLHLQIYIESIGYCDYKMLEYEGTSVYDMIYCIRRKYTEDRALVQLPTFQPGREVVLRGQGLLDFSQATQRKSYADKIFSAHSNRKYFKVECEELCVEQPAEMSEVSEFFSLMEFRVSGSNYSVEEMFKHMVTIGAVHLPLPDYMLNISSTPSNVVSTRTYNSTSI